MHKTRPPPLPDSSSLSLSPTILNCVARNQQTALVDPSPTLSLCVCVWGGLSSSHAYMHIYSIDRSLLHTMYDSLGQAKYLGWTHRTHRNTLVVAHNSLMHHFAISELFPLSLKLSISLGHTYTCISHSHLIDPSKTLSLSLVLSPSHTHTHTISCLAKYDGLSLNCRHMESPCMYMTS